MSTPNVARYLSAEIGPELGGIVKQVIDKLSIFAKTKSRAYDSNSRFAIELIKALDAAKTREDLVNAISLLPRVNSVNNTKGLLELSTFKFILTPLKFALRITTSENPATDKGQMSQYATLIRSLFDRIGITTDPEVLNEGDLVVEQVLPAAIGELPDYLKYSYNADEIIREIERQIAGLLEEHKAAGVN